MERTRKIIQCALCSKMQVEYFRGRKGKFGYWVGKCAHDTSFIGGDSCWRCFSTMNRIAARMARQLAYKNGYDLNYTIKIMQPWAWCVKILRRLNETIRIREIEIQLDKINNH